MNIPIEKLAAELEEWAAEKTQLTVSILITDAYFSAGGGNLLGRMKNDKGEVSDAVWHNNKQRIFRAFRLDTPKMINRSRALAPYVLAAMPAERRAKLTSGDSLQYLTTVAMGHFTAAITALLLGSPDMTVRITRVSEALHAMLPIAQSFIA